MRKLIGNRNTTVTVSDSSCFGFDDFMRGKHFSFFGFDFYLQSPIVIDCNLRRVRFRPYLVVKSIESRMRLRLSSSVCEGEFQIVCIKDGGTTISMTGIHENETKVSR